MKSQQISSENNTHTIYYNYDAHDQLGNSLNRSNGQISEKPITHLFTPRGQYKDFQPYSFGLVVSCEQDDSWGLGTNNLFAKTGAIQYTAGPVFNCTDKIDIYSRYTVKSKPYQIGNSTIVYKQVRQEEVGRGFKVHSFHGYTQSEIKMNIDVTYQSGSHVNMAYGPDDMNASYGWPYTGVFLTNSTVGKPESVSTYRINESDVPVLLKKEMFEYMIDSKEILRTGIVENLFGIVFTGVSHLNKEFCLMESKTSITYDNDGNNPVTNKIEYEYNPYKTHFLPVKITTTNSLGGQITKKFKYSIDYSNDDFGYSSSINISDLKAKNIFGPIEEQKWEAQSGNLARELIQANLYIYDKVSNEDLYQPIKILNFENINLYSGSYFSAELNRNGYPKIDWFNDYTNASYDLKQEIGYYDSGNIKHISKKDGSKTYYIWGYNNSQLFGYFGVTMPLISVKQCHS
ncbi:MAG: hypothetical protein GKR88_09085 [Flavobacteriaceae bacterium]|nr:MAG: hypothetical protein GKR88_09085 [Flavobacteriaceae bacterium]